MKGVFSLLSANNCLTSCFITTCSYFPFCVQVEFDSFHS